MGVLLFSSLLSSVNYKWDVDSSNLVDIVLDSGRLLIFGWLCFRLDRWWTFVITAALALVVVTHFARLLDPAVTHFAMASAQVGLEYLIDLTLLFSVCERWLAGEPAAGPAAWAKADRVTAARRNGLSRGSLDQDNVPKTSSTTAERHPRHPVHPRQLLTIRRWPAQSCAPTR